MTRRKAKATPWLKIALLAAILYVAGILGPLAGFIFAIQRDLILQGVASGDAIVLAVTVAAAIAIGLTIGVWAWLRRLADRV